MASQLLSPNQLRLELQVSKEIEDDGIGMGVFSDGMPYLTGRGLAKLCGVDNAAIVQITTALSQGFILPREAKIASILENNGISITQPYVIVDDGKERYNAFPAPACMAFLEYYAFEAGRNIKEVAVGNYRKLAQKGIRDYILEKVGFNPAKEIDAVWQQYKDRVASTVEGLPDGYFVVFREIADFFVVLINKGADVGIHFVPDISVGRTWSDHWKAKGFDSVYGERIKVWHNYPDSFPQAKSNPQEIAAYPETAIPEFRMWTRKTYLPTKMPSYLSKKVKDGMLSIAEAYDVQDALAPSGNPQKKLK